MATKKKGLGRGLDSLLGSTATSANKTKQSNTTADESPLGGKRATLALEFLRPGPYQPRSIFDKEAIETLADSIRQHGMIQPIVVRQSDTDPAHYDIIAGERRWRASQVAGLHEVPVIIRDIDAQSALAIALIENIQREDLTSIEEANALKRLHVDYQLTHEEVGKAVGRSRTSVSNLIRLLELDEVVQQAVLDKKIDMGHARALLACDKATQVDLTKQIILNGLTVRDTENLTKTYQPSNGKQRKPATKNKDADVIALERRLSETLSAQVTINTDQQGSGKLTIKFANLAVLDGIIEQIEQ